MSVFSQRMATRLNRLSLPMVCSIRARSLYRRLGKKRPRCLEFSRRGITGVMPRASAATRLASLSYGKFQRMGDHAALANRSFWLVCG